MKDNSSRWSRLIPQFRVDKYLRESGMIWPWVLGIELTFPWRSEGSVLNFSQWSKNTEGLGLGLGLGKIDLWFGWPRSE